MENLKLTTQGSHSIEHNKGYKYGYAKGLEDGKEKAIGSTLTPEEARELLYCFIHESQNRYGKVNKDADIYLKAVS